MTGFSELSLAWPWALLLLPLFWWRREAGTGAALRHPDTDAILAAGAATASARPARRYGPGLVWSLLVLAAARPQMPLPEAPGFDSGRAWMLVLDLSASMGSVDLRHDGRALTRLEAGRQALDRLLESRPGDRAGLVIFGREAYLHTPLTPDLATVRAALDTLPGELAGRESALGDGVGLALRHLPAHPDLRAGAAILLVTDGAGNAGSLDPARAGWLAARAGVPVHALHLGSEPPTQLDTLTAPSGGLLRPVTDARGLDDFFAALAAATPPLAGQAHAPARVELYVWPAALALLAAAGLGLRRRTWT